MLISWFWSQLVLPWPLASDGEISQSIDSFRKGRVSAQAPHLARSRRPRLR